VPYAPLRTVFRYQPGQCRWHAGELRGGRAGRNSADLSYRQVTDEPVAKLQNLCVIKGPSVAAT
jgi:hypothetical protein